MIRWIKQNKIPTLFITIFLILALVIGIGSGLGFLSAKDEYVKLIPQGHPNRPGTKNIPIAVVVHYTGNSSFTATDFANRNYFARKYVVKNGKYYEADGKTPFRYASAHWVIDQDSATLCIPQTESAIHAGIGSLSPNNGYNGQTRLAKEIFSYRQNHRSISYEICNNASWERASNNAINIIARDMVDYNIPTDKIYRHFDLTGKICPLAFVRDEIAWNEYKQKIINRVNELKTVNAKKTQAKFILNGQNTTIESYIIDSRNYVGVRELLEKLGYEVIWHQNTQTVEVK